MPNWGAVLKEITDVDAKGGLAAGVSAADVVRRKYMAELHQHTGRNVIAYYSGFLQKPKVEGVAISDEDKNGFMLCAHKVDKKKGLDLILHTPGGDIAATESLVDYLKQMFGENIRAIVPQIAMSAGTMIACSCRELVMGKHSNIGPIDPQLNGIPAIGVLEEVKQAFVEIKADPRAAPAWSPILGRLPPSFLKQCEWAIQRSEEFIKKALEEGVLKHVAEPDKGRRVASAAKRLTDLSYNKAHNKHFHLADCIAMGLDVTELEKPGEAKFQDLVLTVHHCFMHTLSNTPAYKIIENHMARAMIKQKVEQQFLFQLPQQPVQQP
jgi:hypothetical protein